MWPARFAFGPLPRSIQGNSEKENSRLNKCARFPIERVAQFSRNTLAAPSVHLRRECSTTVQNGDLTCEGKFAENESEMCGKSALAMGRDLVVTAGWSDWIYSSSRCCGTMAWFNKSSVCSHPHAAPALLRTAFLRL